MPLKTTSITIKCIVMDFYQVLEKRRTIRDFSNKEVTDEVLEKVLSAAFKAPTNDHLRQFEFIVVRGQENIARLISPVAENTKTIQQTQLKAAENVMDKDGYAMFVDALPKQQRMLIQSNCLILPFFQAKGLSLMQARRPKFLELFRFGLGSRRKHIVSRNSGRAGMRFPYSHWQ